MDNLENAIVKLISKLDISDDEKEKLFKEYKEKGKSGIIELRELVREKNTNIEPTKKEVIILKTLPLTKTINGTLILKLYGIVEDNICQIRIIAKDMTKKMKENLLLLKKSENTKVKLNIWKSTKNKYKQKITNENNEIEEKEIIYKLENLWICSDLKNIEIGEYVEPSEIIGTLLLNINDLTEIKEYDENVEVYGYYDIILLKEKITKSGKPCYLYKGYTENEFCYSFDTPKQDPYIGKVGFFACAKKRKDSSFIMLQDVLFCGDGISNTLYEKYYEKKENENKE